MKKTILLCLLLVACATPQKDEAAAKKGCFLLYNMKTKKFEREEGTACRERVVACSTFKVPLAVMAFDSGALKNEKASMKWDGVKRKLDQWNRDHDAMSWMHYSVVWYSQRLTPKIGKEKIQKYLHDFHYGNEDFEDLKESWLQSPGNGKPSLKISPYEQVTFLESLWNETLPVSKRAMKLTQKLTYLETTPSGFIFSGKTGSNSYDEAGKLQLGWFVAHIEKGDQEYIAVTNFSDLTPHETALFGGMRAKEATIENLKRAGLW